MIPALTPDLRKVLEAVHYRPAVSIVLPFDPKMTGSAILKDSLRNVCDQVEKTLLKEYPAELALLLIQRLKGVLGNLNYSTHKRSIAIFLSPVFEKLLYLDMEMNPSIIIDDSFEIRNLIDCKKPSRQFLVLILQNQKMHVLHGKSGRLKRILSSILAYAPNDSFLQADQILGHLIAAYNLPVFILGNENQIIRFSKITTHSEFIVDSLIFMGTEREYSNIQAMLNCYLDQWPHYQQQVLLNSLSVAQASNRLSSGMAEVWKEARHQNGKLLVLERDFHFDGFHPHNPYSYVKDAVDEIIEKILESGGNVEYVEPGSLKNYNQIALVRYH